MKVLKFKKYFLTLLLLFSSIAVLVPSGPAVAQEEDGGFFSDLTSAVTEGFTNTVNDLWITFRNGVIYVFYTIVSIVAKVLAWALVRMAALLTVFALYSDIVEANAVQLGWTLVRDIANMAFLIMMLAIAIGTILRVQAYNIRALLPKLLVVAVLVNFSRLIVGLFVDVSQIVMLTFLRAFLAAGDIGSALLSLMQVNSFVTSENLDAGETVLAAGAEIADIVFASMSTLVLVVLFTFVTLSVVFLFAMVLLIRIVMLWFLTIISPLAFAASAFPQVQSISKQWWQEFAKYLMIGPCIAFILWLSYASINPLSSITQQNGGIADDSFAEYSDILDFEATPGSGEPTTGIRSVNIWFNFFLAFGLLVGGFMMCLKFSNIAGASVISDKFKGSLRWAGRRLDDRLLSPIARGAGVGTGKLISGTGSLVGDNRIGRRLTGLGSDLQEFAPKMKLRTIPKALALRRERVEEESIRGSAEAGADLFNRQLGFGAGRVRWQGAFGGDVGSRTKSRLYDQKITAAQASEKKELSEVLTQSPEQYQEVLNNLDGKGQLNGNIASETSAAAAVQLMAADRNLNDFMHAYMREFMTKIQKHAKEKFNTSLDTQDGLYYESISKDDYESLDEDSKREYKLDETTSRYGRDVSQAEYEAMDSQKRENVQPVGAYSRKNIKLAMSYLAGGDDDKTAQILSQVEKYAMQANERQLFGLTKVDPKTQKRIMTSPTDLETDRGNVEFSFGAGYEPQQMAREGRAEMYMNQVQRADGGRGYAGLQDHVISSKKNLSELGNAMLTQADRWNSKGKNDFIAEYDTIVKQVLDADLGEDGDGAKIKFIKGLDALKSGVKDSKFSADDYQIVDGKVVKRESANESDSSKPVHSENTSRLEVILKNDASDKSSVDGLVRDLNPEGLSSGVDLKIEREALINNAREEFKQNSRELAVRVGRLVSDGKTDDAEVTLKQLKSELENLRNVNSFEGRIDASEVYQAHLDDINALISDVKNGRRQDETRKQMRNIFDTLNSSE